ncbi:MAG: hypothetical protein P8L78_13530 [Mariniblastus sp.]|nr:hypothetical protein [Mariniblastus sp.]
MTTQEEQIEILNKKLSELENESRRILNALRWATKVRMILFAGLLVFAVGAVFKFTGLYNEIKNQRIVEVQRIIQTEPEKFAEPLTKQLVQLMEEQGPYVIEVFREQAEKDSDAYMDAFDVEREQLIANVEEKLKVKLAASYEDLLSEQEKLLVRQYPVLEDPEKLKLVRGNVEGIYEKIGDRYYLDFLQEQIEILADRLESFPITDSEQGNVPVSEQILAEMLELVRLMLIHSENYQMPVKKDVSTTAGAPKADPQLKAPDVGKTKQLPAKPEPTAKGSDDENADAGESDDGVDEVPKKDN